MVGSRGEGGERLSLATGGVQCWLFLWKCLYELRTHLSARGKIFINDDVYHKSCSARVNFYKINGAKTISSIVNPSVSLGKHRDLPCEHGSGSLHLLLAAVPERIRSTKCLHSRAVPCLFGLSSLQRVAGHPGRSAQPSKD